MQRAAVKAAGPKHRESHAQRALFRWIRKQGNLLPGLEHAFAIPNGAYLQGDKLQRAKRWGQLKAEGAQEGVSDIFVPVPRGQFHGLWIEMKAAKPHDAAVTPAQWGWIAAMRTQGYEAVLCRGEREAMAAILDYYNMGVRRG
ncbi:MAG TPA: VRR-NUC domain-containing protein [Gammaproteobacteria bacterium]|nr:VRR-NUC domain-containing protein [Gammaproteobacteria bacterium]